MREWPATIDAVDRRTAVVVATGLYRLEHEGSLTVTDVYDDGPELLRALRNGREPGSRRPSRTRSAMSRSPSACARRSGCAYTESDNRVAVRTLRYGHRDGPIAASRLRRAGRRPATRENRRRRRWSA